MKKLIIIVAALAMLCALAAQDLEETTEGDASQQKTIQVEVDKADDGVVVVVNEDGEVTTYSGDYSDEEIQALLSAHDVTYEVIDALDGAAFFAQLDDDEREELEEEMRQVRLELSQELGQAGRVSLSTPVNITLGDENMDTPYMGVYSEDMTLTEARELGYDKMYGVRITGVVSNSPARLYRIREDDIIMQIGDEKVLNKKSFVRIIESHYIGDAVVMKVFRDGHEEDIDFVFGSRAKKTDEEGIEVGKPAKKRLNPGDGGGGWIPVFFQPDLDDINEMVTSFGFNEIDDKGLFLNGFGGKGNVGKGWMLGGMGCWYKLDRKTNNFATDPATIRRMRFSVGYGGVTLDKRIPISRKFITSLGFMLGWGGWKLEVTQTDGAYDWNNLNNTLNNSNNNYLEISKNYIMIQPKAMVMYRILDWLAIRGEVGYMASYSFYNGWKANVIDEDYEVANSPDTTFDGLTFTVGPWFGF